MDAHESGAEQHVPVLLDAVLLGLAVKRDGNYIDGTFGRGGHSGAILEQLGPEGRLLSIDRDPQAIAEADSSLTQDARFELTRNDIAQLETIAVDRQLAGRIDGIVFDLGVSSPQLDQAARGFSFRSDGPLDMRMDPDRQPSAADWLSVVEERELIRVLRRYGEEPHARRIARAIVDARREAALTTTGQLAAVVSAAVPRGRQQKHPATKTFQAVRIFINDELAQLERALEASVRVLRRGGRLCVISFHSLEDRIVKRFMRDQSREPEAYRGMPDVPAEHRPRLKTVGKAVMADAAEVERNPRSRSARLRIAERT